MADPTFAETLPADIRADPVFKDIKDLPGLAKSYHSAAKMVGMDKARILALPNDDKPESWAPVFNQLGRPEKADGYQLPKRADNKDYSAEEVAFQKAVLPLLHEAGLSQRQVNAIIPKWNALMDETRARSDTATRTEMEAASAKLKTELGASYTEKLGLAQQALTHVSQELDIGDQLSKELDATKLGNNPGMFKLLAHIGAQLKEDGVLGKAGAGENNLSPTEAEQQIRAKFDDPKFMKSYTNKRDPGHKDAVADMQRLFEMKAAAKAA